MRLLPRMSGVEAQIGIGMKDGRSGKPAVRKSDKARPSEPVFLTATPKRTHPATDHLQPKTTQTGQIPGNRMIVEVSLHYGPQPFPEFRHGQMFASSKLLLQRSQFGGEPLVDGLA